MDMARSMLLINILLHVALLLFACTRKLAFRQNLTVLLLLTTTLSCGLFIVYEANLATPLGLAALCLALLSGGIMHLHGIANDRASALHASQNQLARSEEEQKQQQAFIVQYQSMREFRHEIKNTLLVLWGYLQAQDLDSMQQLLQELLQDAAPVRELTVTGYPALDALLAAKTRQARSLQVDLRISLILPSPPTVAERDICTIIGNLFDNALEAVSRLAQEQRFIFLFSRQLNTTWQIEMINSSDGHYIKEGERLRSTKVESQSHGIGLDLIERLAEKYDGYVAIQPESTRFGIAVYLPLN